MRTASRAATRSRPRLRGRIPARRRQRPADEPLGPQHAAAGDLRAGPRTRTGLPARPAAPPRAVVSRVHRRRADFQLARADGLLPFAPVRAAAGAGDRGVHQGRAARPAVDSACNWSRPKSPTCWNAPRGCTGATTAAITSSATTAPWRPSSCCTTACRGWPASTWPASRPPACCVACSAPASPMPRCWTIATRRCAWATASKPLSARYQAMFDVARQALQLPQTQVQDWLDMRPSERAPWLERADLRASAALLLLEQAALRRQELLARDELKRRFLGRDADRNAGRRGCARGPAGHPAPGGFPQPPGDCCCRTPATACRRPKSARRWRRKAATCSAVAAAKWLAAKRGSPMAAAGTASCAGWDRGQCRCAGRATAALASGTRGFAVAEGRSGRNFECIALENVSAEALFSSPRPWDRCSRSAGRDWSGRTCA